MVVRRRSTREASRLATANLDAILSCRNEEKKIRKDWSYLVYNIVIYTIFSYNIVIKTFAYIIVIFKLKFMVLASYENC